MKKALIIATVGGFLKKFELGNVRILQEMGYEVHYAANMKNQVYRFEPGTLEAEGIRLHHIDIRRQACKNTFHMRQASGKHRQAMGHGNLIFLHDVHEIHHDLCHVNLSHINVAILKK